MKFSIQIADRAALPGLREDWNLLCQRMEYPTPFASWEWANAWVNTVGRAATVRIVLARQGEQVIGILPLATRSSGVAPLGRTFVTLGAELVYPDHLALIANAASVATLLPAMLRAAIDISGGSSRVDLPFIVRGSEMDLACIAAASALPALSRQVAQAPHIPIVGTYTEFLEGLSSNERYKIRSRTKKLLINKGAHYGEPVGLELHAVLGRLRELHALRAVQKGMSSSFDLEEIQQFHRRLIESLPQEQLMFRCLSTEKDIFALFYGFVFQNKVFYFQLGYDPAWSAFSPGIVLLSEVIREAHERGCSEFNFLQGNESFKQTWTKKHRVLTDWTFHEPNPLGRVRWSMELGTNWLKQRAKRFLTRNDHLLGRGAAA